MVLETEPMYGLRPRTQLLACKWSRDRIGLGAGHRGVPVLRAAGSSGGLLT